MHFQAIIASLLAFAQTNPEVVYIVAGLTGMLAHYIKKWTRGETKSSLYAYLFTDAPRSTIAALMTYAGAVMASLATGAISHLTPWLAASMGFTLGFSIDSAMNKTGNTGA